MKTEKFNELFDFAKKSKIKAGDGLKEGLYPFYTSSATLSKRIDVFQEDRISLIFGTGGKASIHYVEEQFSTSTDCIVAYKKEDKDFNEKFVFYYLFGNIHILEQGFKGAGLKHISKKYIQNLDIPILPIKTQNKIVSLLNKADSLLQEREQSIALLDELLRAQFLEMFGDPILNPNGWERVHLKEYYFDPKKGTKCGPFGSALKKNEYTENGIPVWNMDNISKTSEFNSKPNLFITNEKFKDLKTYETLNGDIIVSRAGTVGKMAIVNTDFVHSIISTNLIRIRFGEKLLPQYFISLMKYAGNGVGRLKRGADGAFTHMNTKILDSLEFPYPPLELQERYLSIFSTFYDKKETLTQSKIELEHLFNSLIQEAFKGEIEVSNEEVKKKDSIMSEIKKKEGEKVDITNLDLATFLGIPDEITYTQEKWMFDLMSLDEFYQFLLKDNFTKEESFTLQDIEEKLHLFFYHGGDMDFPNANWQQIIFKFLEAKPPLLKQIFEEETATVKLKLTDETFKA